MTPTILLGNFVRVWLQGEECVALVTKVWSQELLNLAVFTPNGEVTPMTSVSMQTEGKPFVDGRWHYNWEDQASPTTSYNDQPVTTTEQ